MSPNHLLVLWLRFRPCVPVAEGDLSINEDAHTLLDGTIPIMLCERQDRVSRRHFALACTC